MTDFNIVINDWKNYDQKLDIAKYNNLNTSIVVVDVINGFIKTGALADNKIMAIVPKIKSLLKSLPKAKQYFVRDCHNSTSKEFKSFPQHCQNDLESELVDELKPCAAAGVDITKNSTNSFFNFLPYFNENETKTIIIVGDCTDICILQFALTMNSFINEYNFDTELIILSNLVDTFNSPTHNSKLMNAVSLRLMSESGIQIKVFEEKTC